MAVLAETLVYLVAGSKIRRRWQGENMSGTRRQQRELAKVMRRLPARYADRLPVRALERITGAAAAGQWETAVDRLIRALRSRAETVTPDERDELRALLEAMDMPGERADTLLTQH